VVEAELSISCYQDDSFIKKIVIRWEQSEITMWGYFNPVFIYVLKRFLKKLILKNKKILF